MGGNLQTSNHADGISTAKRHLLVLGLHTGTLAYIMWNSFVILRAGGIGPFEVFLLICTFFGAVSPTVDLWTIIIGLCVMMFGSAEKSLYPYFDEKSPLPGLHTKTALTIYMRNEEPDLIFDRLLAMYESLSQTGRLGNFRFVLLSDTSDPDVIRMEERTFERLKGKLSTGTFGPAFYRRRSKNIGFKAGNAFDYVEHHSDGDDFFVSLDSDSTMSGELLVRLASSMEKHPQIGMIQTQFATTPSVSGFSRIMYFFSAHVQNTGLSWWYKDSAMYWGHNAIIRTRAFLENCKLPVLKERAPLGGFILSHDIIESMFMRRAGYEVRLLPVETGSYEAHPPTFIDHMRRELRWCRGTIQYIVLLRQPGLKFISRIQICQVLASHLGPTVWTVMTLATIIKSTLVHSDAHNINDLGAYSQLLQINMNAFPRIISIVWIAAKCVKGYGDGIRWAISIFLHLLYMALIGPTMSVAITALVFSSFIHSSFVWDAQNRDRLGLGWRDAYRTLWLPTVIGIGIASVIVTQDGFTAFRLSMLALSLSLGVPTAVLTASPYLSQITLRLRLFMIPEEFAVPPVLSSIVGPEIHSLSLPKAKNS